MPVGNPHVGLAPRAAKPRTWGCRRAGSRLSVCRTLSAQGRAWHTGVRAGRQMTETKKTLNSHGEVRSPQGESPGTSASAGRRQCAAWDTQKPKQTIRQGNTGDRERNKQAHVGITSTQKAKFDWEALCTYRKKSHLSNQTLYSRILHITQPSPTCHVTEGPGPRPPRGRTETTPKPRALCELEPHLAGRGAQGSLGSLLVLCHQRGRWGQTRGAQEGRCRRGCREIQLLQGAHALLSTLLTPAQQRETDTPSADPPAYDHVTGSHHRQ